MADDSTDDRFEEDEEQRGIHSFDGQLLRRIAHYLKPYLGWVVLALAITLVGSFLGPLRPWLVQRGIDNYIVVGDLEGLQRIIFYLALALLGEGLLSFAENYLTQ
ncbi:MAG TPA: hypothetical protein VJ884_07740, partial [Salinibacter sp.]|nr:hypothetical protein [Salinibacter sp.]